MIMIIKKYLASVACFMREAQTRASQFFHY